MPQYFHFSVYNLLSEEVFPREVCHGGAACVCFPLGHDFKKIARTVFSSIISSCVSSGAHAHVRRLNNWNIDFCASSIFDGWRYTFPSVLWRVHV